MSQSQSPLITSFFKPPPEREVGDGAVCHSENSLVSLGGGEGEGERFSVDLKSLLCGAVPAHTALNGHQMSPFHTTGLENGDSSLSPVSTGLELTSPPSPVGSGMRQGTLSWDTSNGTLALKTPLTADSSSSERGGGRRERMKNGCDGGRRRREGPLVVSVRRCILRRVPGDSGGLQLEPDSGSEVEVTGSNLDESVMILRSSPPPPPPPSSAPLSAAWAKIFSRPIRSPATPTLSPATSPRKRGRRSASCSPRRKPPGSPRRPPGSPRRPPGSPHRPPGSPHRPPGSPRRPPGSPQKGTCSTPASPLKRALINHSSDTRNHSSSKRAKLEADHAPFSELVHIRQYSVPDPFWNLTPAGTSLRPSSTTASRVPSLQPSLTSCLSLNKVGGADHTPQLTPVTSGEQQASVLERLISDHPQEKVSRIFQRYRRIREGVADHTQSPPTLLGRRGKKRESRGPLVCKIHILNRSRRGRGGSRSVRGGRGGVRVDGEVYRDKKKPLRKKSLRLGRRRARSPSAENSVGEGLIQGGVKEVKGQTENSEMWTELYRPKSRSEVIGNKVKVQQLFDWLQSWRDRSCIKPHPPAPPPGSQRRTSDLNRNVCSRESSPTPEWARGGNDFLSLTHLYSSNRRRRRKRVVLSSSESDSESEGEGEGVSPVMLLCGGVGSGKTAAVHACAAELDCKVFEVNSTTIRSRGALLAILKEATLSHQVSVQPSAGTTPSERGVKDETRGRKKKKTAGNGLLTFFQPVGQRERRQEETVATDNTSGCAAVSLESSTVLLLEEVDVLFESDRGFWSAVYELAATTRRPIILTCNDPRHDLECDHLKIVFDRPPLAELGLHIQLLCLSHDYHMTSEAAIELADSLNIDIRQVFLSLQFWLSHPHQTPPHTLTTLTHGTPPRLHLPWRSSRPHPLTSDLYRDIDMVSHRADQHSYMDVVATGTMSGDSHMTSDDVITRPWWRKGAEPAGVLDELPMRESEWRQELMVGGVCEEVMRGIGGRVKPHPHYDPTSWSQLTRRVQSVRDCLERCSEVFSLPASPVGVVTDSLPLLRTLCLSEHQRQLTNTKRRFRHYLQQCTAVELTDLDNLHLITRFTTHTHSSL